MFRRFVFVSTLIVAGGVLSAQQATSEDDVFKRLREGVAEDPAPKRGEKAGNDSDDFPFSIQGLTEGGVSPNLIGAAVHEPMQPAVGWSRSAAQTGSPLAQPTKVTVFAGYSYGRLSLDGLGGHLNANGFNLAVSGHLTNWLAISGDVSGHFTEIGPSDVSIFNFAAGPELTPRRGRFRGVSRFLVGVGRISEDFFGVSAAQSSFSTIFGGAFDFGITKRLAIRVLQSEWLRLWDVGGSGEAVSMWRLSFGVVGRF